MNRPERPKSAASATSLRPATPSAVSTSKSTKIKPPSTTAYTSPKIEPLKKMSSSSSIQPSMESNISKNSERAFDKSTSFDDIYKSITDQLGSAKMRIRGEPENTMARPPSMPSFGLNSQKSIKPGASTTRPSTAAPAVRKPPPAPRPPKPSEISSDDDLSDEDEDSLPSIKSIRQRVEEQFQVYLKDDMERKALFDRCSRYEHEHHKASATAPQDLSFLRMTAEEKAKQAEAVKQREDERARLAIERKRKQEEELMQRKMYLLQLPDIRREQAEKKRKEMERMARGQSFLVLCIHSMITERIVAELFTQRYQRRVDWALDVLGKAVVKFVYKKRSQRQEWALGILTKHLHQFRAFVRVRRLHRSADMLRAMFMEIQNAKKIGSIIRSFIKKVKICQRYARKYLSVQKIRLQLLVMQYDQTESKIHFPALWSSLQPKPASASAPPDGGGGDSSTAKTPLPAIKKSAPPSRTATPSPAPGSRTPQPGMSVSGRPSSRLQDRPASSMSNVSTSSASSGKKKGKLESISFYDMHPEFLDFFCMRPYAADKINIFVENQQLLLVLKTPMHLKIDLIREEIKQRRREWIQTEDENKEKKQTTDVQEMLRGALAGTPVDLASKKGSMIRPHFPLLFPQDFMKELVNKGSTLARSEAHGIEDAYKANVPNIREREKLIITSVTDLNNREQMAWQWFAGGHVFTCQGPPSRKSASKLL